MADATEVSYPEIASNIADNYDQIIAAANSLISDSSLASDLPFEPQAARVVGVFVGAAPDNGFVGIESQTLVLYDTVTGEFGEYYYLGGTLGASLSVPGLGWIEGGVVLFDGPIAEVPGWSGGMQWASGITIGVSNTPSGYQMIQIGGQAGFAGEMIAGYTWGGTDEPTPDWALIERNLQEVYAENPQALRAALASLAQAKAVPQWTDDFMRAYGTVVSAGDSQCFLAGTSILLADGTEKPIEEIAPGDWVMSYNAAGNLVPGRVSRTFQKDAKHILDFFGLMVTPGHVMLCGAGRYSGRHVTLLDILRSDGAVVQADGGLIRAATGVPVGSELDAEIEVVTGTAGPKGFVVRAAGRLRMGTRVILENGADLSLAELIAANGGHRTEAGLIASAAGKGPFVWPFGPNLPQPEDYVLARSAVTLAEIYAAAEWETAPALPGPARGDLGPVGAAPAARDPATLDAGAKQDGPAMTAAGAKTPPVPTSEEFLRTMGQVSWLMTLSPEHRDRPIRYLEAHLAAPLMLKQVRVVTRGSQPVAALPMPRPRSRHGSRRAGMSWRLANGVPAPKS